MLVFGLIALAALAGAAFAARQIALHIVPGDPGYGSALFGLHSYSWAFIAFAAAIALIAVVMRFDRQFEGGAPEHAGMGLLLRVPIGLILLLTALNVVSTILQCGFAACPDDPTDYELLRRLR